TRAKARPAPRFCSCNRRPPRRQRSVTCSKSCRRALMRDAGAGTEILNLGGDFPAVSTETWEAAIAKDLKGGDYEKKLVWRTEEGLAIRPYYRKEVLAGLDDQLQTSIARYPFVRGMGR